MKTRNAFLALVCGLAAGGAAALSLGGAHGRVLLGRPVDLFFEVQLDPGMDLDSACLAAELVSGENTVPPGRVRVMPLPSARDKPPTVRVQTTVLADEPVLTVSLSVGCAGKITRTYTFLADLPDSVPPSTAPIAIPWDAQQAPSVALERVGTGGAASSDAAAPPAAAPARVSAASVPEQPPREAASAAQRRPVVAPAAPPARAARPPASAAAASPDSKPAAMPQPARPRPSSRPRLVMEPLAVVMSQSPRADASAAQPSAAPAQPAASAPDVAASMPQAPASVASGAADAASAPQGAQPESLRVLKLQEELARMRMQAASDHAAALALQQRVERIESERFHPGVVYGLLALVGLLLAWMAWQVLRFRTAFEQSSLAWSESVAMHERKKAGADD